MKLTKIIQPTINLTALSALVMMALCVLAIPVQAQSRWLKTVEVITPVSDEQITGPLLDSLVTVASRNDIPVKRSPEDEEEISMQQLDNQLLDEGLDYSSATHVFVTYQYEASQLGLTTNILDMYFIFRPAGGFDENDIPILYLDATHPSIRNTLISSGTQLRVNEAAFLPFWDQLMINKLPQESQVVAEGGEIIRDSEEAKAVKAQLLATIRKFMYR